MQTSQAAAVMAMIAAAGVSSAAYAQSANRNDPVPDEAEAEPDGDRTELRGDADGGPADDVSADQRAAQGHAGLLPRFQGRHQLSHLIIATS